MSFILFVCAQNHNRSILCEHRLRQLLKERKDVKSGEIEVDSAGSGWPDKDYAQMYKITGQIQDKNVYGKPPDPFALNSMKRRGIDASQSRSKALTQDMVKKADLIVIFSPPYREHIISMFPEAEGKLYVLQELAGYPGYVANTLTPEGCMKYNSETKKWSFNEWYIEACLTEVDILLWWAVDKMLELVRKKK